VQPAPVPYPAEDPLVVKLYGEAIFVLKDSKLKVWGVTFGGEKKVKVRARVVARTADRTMVIEGQPIANPLPPADFGFSFDPVPLRTPLQIVLDAWDKTGRTARDIANFVAVGAPKEQFNIDIDMVDNRSSGCSVYAYGTANMGGSYVADVTNITAGGKTVAGSAIAANEWWDWAVHYPVPEDFPLGGATLKVTCKVDTSSGTETDTDSRPITIDKCKPPDTGTGGED
jgi:hypothetical protein